ncbi:MAG: hypothetical protein JNK43_10345, partial [Ignavibacteria bacterium]|nr:hypothetical protein [Ignavibacteria bacterium]
DAFISFRKGDHENALKHISGLKPEAVVQKNILYRLKICCLIEAGYFDSASDPIDTYQRFLNGNSQVSSVIRKYGTDFLNGIRIVLESTEYPGKTDAGELTKAADMNRNSHFAWWFREKSNELRP